MAESEPSESVTRDGLGVTGSKPVTRNAQPETGSPQPVTGGPPLDPTLDAALRDSAKRNDLNPIQIGDRLQELKDLGWIDPDIQEKYRFSDGQPTQYRRLLGLPEATKELLRKKELDFTQGRLLCQLLDGHAEQIPGLAQRILQEKLSGRQVDAAVRDIMGKTRAVGRTVDAPFGRGVRRRFRGAAGGPR